MLAGQGALTFTAARSVTRAVSRSPLRLLLPRNHGHARWAFVATLGGGLVDGDSIDLDVCLEPGANAMLGTQSSTKIYRGRSKQRIRARIADDAMLAVLPDPIAPFAASRFAQSMTYELAPRGSLVVLDVLSCGRAAAGERWAFARFESRIRIPSANINDSLVLDANEVDVPAMMGRFDAIATVFAIGPGACAIADALMASASTPRAAGVVRAASPVAGGVCLRAASPRLESLLAYVRDTLSPLRDQLGDDPFARKW
jgi:urease accessory protein